MPLLVILALGCFASSLVIRLTDPLVPQIARDLSALPATTALLASAFTFPYAFGQPILGPLADTLGKARVIKGCLAMLAFAMALSIVATDLKMLFAARMLAGLAAGGVIPVALAMVGDRFDLAERQVALSRLLGVMLFGQICGALGSGLVGAAFGWRNVMAIGTTVVAVALAFTLLRLEPRTTVARKPFSLAAIRQGYATVFANPRAKICFTAVFVEGVCVLGLVPYLAVLLEERGAGGTTEAGLVLAGLGTGGILYSVMVKFLLARLDGQMNVMRCGGVTAGVGLAAYAFAHAATGEAIGFLILGLGFYMLHNSLQTQATELAPGARGAAVAMHASFFFAGQAAGPVLYQLGIANVGSRTSVLAAAAVMAALGLWTAHLLERAPAPKKT